MIETYLQLFCSMTTPRKIAIIVGIFFLGCVLGSLVV